MTTVNPFSATPTPTTCTWVKQCLIPFADGVFPAWVHRDVYGDRAIPADDAVLIAKVPPLDAPASPAGHGFGFVLWPDTAPAAPQITAASLAGPIPGPAPFTAGPLIPGPWWPPVDYPCNCITVPPVNPPLPEPAPVPLPASSICLLAGLAALALLRRRK